MSGESTDCWINKPGAAAACRAAQHQPQHGQRGAPDVALAKGKVVKRRLDGGVEGREGVGGGGVELQQHTLAHLRGAQQGRQGSHAVSKLIRAAASAAAAAASGGSGGSSGIQFGNSMAGR